MIPLRVPERCVVGYVQHDPLRHSFLTRACCGICGLTDRVRNLKLSMPPSIISRPDVYMDLGALLSTSDRYQDPRADGPGRSALYLRSGPPAQVDECFRGQGAFVIGCNVSSVRMNRVRRPNGHTLLWTFAHYRVRARRGQSQRTPHSCLRLRAEVVQVAPVARCGTHQAEGRTTLAGGAASRLRHSEPERLTGPHRPETSNG
jgi:hypothetical protein